MPGAGASGARRAGAAGTAPSSPGGLLASRRAPREVSVRSARGRRAAGSGARRLGGPGGLARPRLAASGLRGAPPTCSLPRGGPWTPRAPAVRRPRAPSGRAEGTGAPAGLGPAWQQDRTWSAPKQGALERPGVGGIPGAVWSAGRPLGGIVGRRGPGAGLEGSQDGTPAPGLSGAQAGRPGARSLRGAVGGGVWVAP